MAKVRENKHILFNKVGLYQDLSQITVRQHRALRPLLQQLRARNLVYKWQFPFCLSTTYQKRSYNLCTPGDLPDFCTQLQMEVLFLPDWRPDFLLA